MSDFRKPVVLLIKCAVLLSTVVVTYLALLYAISYRDQDSYIAANLDKMRLLKETPSPRMILIGGSNLAFGLDSSKIRQAFNIPVVNMGLRVDIGLKFMLDQINPYLKRGDIVVVVPEYELFTENNFYGNIDTLFDLAMTTRDWSALKGMSVLTMADSLLKQNSNIFAYKPALIRDPTTLRKSINKDGDYTAHLMLKNQKFRSNAIMSTNVNLKGVQYLQRFIASNAGRGVTTLVVYPCLQRSFYRRNASTVEIIASELSKSVRVASTPQDFVYDDTLFFNSVHHLNAQGRALRSEKMIQVLTNALLWNGGRGNLL